MKKIILCLLLLIVGNSFAQKLIAIRDSVQNGYNFWLYVPENYDPVKADMPVVISLHGKSLKGTDLNQVLRYGAMTGVVKYGKDRGALIVSPQTPDYWNPDKIEKVRQWVLDRYPADSNRVYVLGMSMGGSGTTDYVGNYPNKVAAAMALCGGVHLRSFKGLNEIPYWVIHGTADEATNISSSQRIVSEIQKAGPAERLLYTWLEGYDHGKLARFYYMDMTFNWLFSHSLADKGRPVNRDFTIVNDEITNAYSGGDKKLVKRIIKLDPQENPDAIIVNPKDDPEYIEKMNAMDELPGDSYEEGFIGEEIENF